MRKIIAFIVTIIVTILLSAVFWHHTTTTPPVTPPVTPPATDEVLTGAGSSFIYPLLSQLKEQYSQAKINYQAIGSGGGISQLSAGTIDFAATDVPFGLAELSKRGWIQFPIAMSGIVPVVNVSGVKSGELVLNGSTLANIYLGKIRYWDDPAIKALNRGVTLPHQNIILVYRVGGSGTTFNFTHYLADVSPQWQHDVGVNTLVAWPKQGLGAKGNAGIAATVARIPGSIGYVEYTYTVGTELKRVKMQNQAGQVVKASLESFSSAFKRVDWRASEAFYGLSIDKSDKHGWPIMAITYMLLSNKMDPAKRQQIIDFFKWSYTDPHAQQAAQQLLYVMPPVSVLYDAIKNQGGG